MKGLEEAIVVERLICEYHKNEPRQAKWRVMLPNRPECAKFYREGGALICDECMEAIKSGCPQTIYAEEA